MRHAENLDVLLQGNKTKNSKKNSGRKGPQSNASDLSTKVNIMHSIFLSDITADSDLELSGCV